MKSRRHEWLRRTAGLALSAVMAVSSIGVLPALAAAGGAPINMYELSNVNRDKEKQLAVLFPYIHGNDVVGSVLTAKYTLSVGGISSSPDSPDYRDQSTFRWFACDTRNGSYEELAGQTGRELALTDAHLNKYIRVEVTPRTASGTGRALMSDPVGPVMSKADFDQITLKLTKDGTYLGDREKLSQEIASRFSNVTYFTVDTVIDEGDQTPVQHLAGSSFYYKNGARAAFDGSRPTMEDGKVMVNAKFVSDILGGTYDFKGQTTAALDDVLKANGKQAFYADKEVEKATNGNWRTTAMAEGLIIISDAGTDLGLNIIKDRDVLNELTNQCYNLHASEEELDWFKDATLGMFIHWDPGTRTGQEIGWGRGPGPYKITEKYPTYDLSYLDFDPTDFDAPGIAKKAKEMGCKYLVFTTKHHAGFCSWDTNYYPEHSIAGTPYAKDKAAEDYDIVSQLADACHAEGLKFGLYYSPQDWYNNYCWSDEHYRWMETYMGHLTELMSKYGKIDIFWCDAIGSALSQYQNEAPDGYANDAAWSAWDPRTILRRVKQLQPGIITNDRYAYRWEDPKPWNKGGLPEDIRGDYITPEQTTAGFNDEFAWESCLTIDGGNAWSYNYNSGAKDPVRVTRDIIQNSVNGGNVLLNMGLMPNGQFSSYHVAAFETIGSWVVEHGEALYNTRGGPYVQPSWGGSTYRVEENGTKTIYLHIGKSINGAQLIKNNFLEIPDPQNGEIYNKATLLDGTPVSLMPTEEGGYILTLPAGQAFADCSDMDHLDTIIKLEHAEMPALTGMHFEQQELNLKAGKKGTLTLVAEPEGAALPKLNWKSDHHAVAMVKNGVVSGIGEGTCVISATAADGSCTAKCTVHVAGGNVTNYGTNMIDYNHLTASTSSDEHLPADCVDNDLTTAWHSDLWSYENPEWLKVDLIQNRPFNRIVLCEPADKVVCSKVSIQISDDNIHWVEIASNPGIGEELVLDLPAGVRARYVKAEIFTVSNTTKPKITEFGIYNSEDSQYQPNTEADLAISIGDVQGHVDVNRHVTMEAPIGTDLSALEPQIVISAGATIKPQGPQNFTKPVIYTVTSEDGKTIMEYTIDMTVATGVVKGANLAANLDKSAYTASSEDYNSYTNTVAEAGYAFDGAKEIPSDTNHYWMPTTADRETAWLQVDFGTPTTFNTIEFYSQFNGMSKTKSLELQTSDDGVNFTPIQTIEFEDIDDPHHTITLEQNETARFLRVAKMTASWRFQPVIVNEVEVYNVHEDPNYKMTGIEVTKAPDKTQYEVYEAFDPTGMEISANYSDGTSAVVRDYAYSPILGMDASVKNIKISYMGKSVLQPVTVGSAEAEKILSGIEVTKEPTKTTYQVGETFDPAGMEVTAKYSDGTSEIVTGFTCAPDGALKQTDTVITVTYGGKQAKQAIKVENPITGISITRQPTKTVYTAGETFDPAGMEVTAKYYDGSTKVVADYTFLPEGALKTSDTMVMISYEGKLTAVMIQVKQPVVLTGIEITRQPAKTAYQYGEAFDAAGMEVTARYSDGSTKAVTDYTVTPNGTLTDAITKVTVHYGDFEADVTITVAEKPHNVSKDWTSDETGHWHSCTDCTEKHDFEAHTFGQWTTRTEPTCTEDGLKVRTCTVCGYEQTEKLEALGHQWQAPTYTWSEDHKSCTAERICARDASHVETAKAVVSSEVIAEPTYETKGTTRYTAVFEASWAETQTKELQNIPMPGIHVPGSPVKPETAKKPAEPAAPVMSFTDVAQDAWYYDSVQLAVEKGLIDGMTTESFEPNGNLTVAQAIKLAAALNELNRRGMVSLENGTDAWYSTYVQYAIDNDIIDEAYGSYTGAQMNEKIDRSEFVKILHGAMSTYLEKNKVADNAIPDVKQGSKNAEEIYDFYRAGILIGSDEAGNFYPASSIKRSEVAAILVRMFEPSVRESITLN